MVALLVIIIIINSSMEVGITMVEVLGPMVEDTSNNSSNREIVLVLVAEVLAVEVEVEVEQRGLEHALALVPHIAPRDVIAHALVTALSGRRRMIKMVQQTRMGMEEQDASGIVTINLGEKVCVFGVRWWDDVGVCLLFLRFRLYEF